MFKRISWPLTLCLVGGIIALVGELEGANDKQPGDTISEVFRGLPLWLKCLISWLFGAVCSHLWEWRISDPAVQVAGDVNVDVHQDKP